MFIEFFKKRLVKKPKKTYKCYLCGLDITTKHYYISTLADGDFLYYRTHIGCCEMAEQMCSDCIYSDDCQSSICECYDEKYNSLSKEEW